MGNLRKSGAELRDTRGIGGAGMADQPGTTSGNHAGVPFLPCAQVASGPGATSAQAAYRDRGGCLDRWASYPQRGVYQRPGEVQHGGHTWLVPTALYSPAGKEWGSVASNREFHTKTTGR